MKGSLDMLDRRIMDLLQKDSRMSSTEISRRLNVPARTVRHRIDQMVQRKDIFPTVLVNHEKFGYRMTVDILCQVEIDKIGYVAELLKDFPEISYIAYSLGDRDLSIQAYLEDSDQVIDFVQKLAIIPEILRTNTVLVPRIIKNNNEWLPPETDFKEFHKEEKSDIKV